VNNHRFVFAGLLGFIATTIQPQVTLAYTAETIGLRAKEVTVVIESKQESGSGVIIGRQGAQYSVLTNWHVLKSKQSFVIETSDGAKHQIFPSSIQHIGNLDLAVCTFTSSKFYRVVEFGNSDTLVEGSSLYITGAPANLKGIASRSVLVVGGQLVGYNRADQDGYTLIYNNNTMPGMSGGPVIDSNGNLIGIHGRGSQDQNATKSGFNLGIPINLFVQSASQLGIKYTLEQPRLDRKNPSLVAPAPSTQGRPRVVDGSEGSSGACAGDRC
jgi:serine protease Do